MALSFVSRVGASPLGRAGVAIFFILALAGLVQFGLPMACTAEAVVCSGEAVEPVAALDEALADGPVDAAPTAQEDGEQASPVAAPTQIALADMPLPTISHNDLIASTFAALDVELTAQPAELTSRAVKTVAINADGTPAGATAASEPLGLETEAPAPLVAETPADEAGISASSEPAAPVQTAEASAEESSPSLAYAPARGDVAEVTGKGANVRSLPQKGGSEVLFALRGGDEVTIVEMRKGWAKVVDQQGRSGWIYGQYLRR